MQTFRLHYQKQTNKISERQAAYITSLARKTSSTVPEEATLIAFLPYATGQELIKAMQSGLTVEVLPYDPAEYVRGVEGWLMRWGIDFVKGGYYYDVLEVYRHDNLTEYQAANEIKSSPELQSSFHLPF